MEIIVGIIIFSLLIVLLIVILIITNRKQKGIKEELNALFLSSKLLKLEKNKILDEWLFQKLLNICEKDFNLPVFIRSLEEINYEEKDENCWACGKYYYLKGKTVIEQKKLSNELISLKKELNYKYDLAEYVFPRIEVSEEKNPWVLAHELGHHLLSLNNIEQSEIGADNQIYEIFRNLINEEFLFYYFQISIKVHSKNEKFNENRFEITKENYKEVKSKMEDFINRNNINIK